MGLKEKENNNSSINTKKVKSSKKNKDEIIVVASGYFDPLHKGHVEYLNLAKKLGTKLIVIVNNDKQAIIKKGKSYMDEKERMFIVSSLKSVDEVFLSIDQDSTVCKSLELLKPNIFAKGGDRFSTEIPETPICKRNRIKIVDGLGEKIQSSRNILKLMNKSK